jgi:hypothetical protein
VTSDGSKTLTWGDGEYRFRLAIGELRELESLRNAPAVEILQRLIRGAPWTDDIIHVIRLGLIGGGMEPTKALAKVGRYCYPPNVLPNAPAAADILAAALFPPAGEEVKKNETAMPDNSNGPPSSETPRPSDGQSINSTAQAFGNFRPPLTAGTDATEPAMTNGRDQ